MFNLSVRFLQGKIQKVKDANAERVKVAIAEAAKDEKVIVKKEDGVVYIEPPKKKGRKTNVTTTQET